ncbi:oligosaccharyltransferase subunit ribophorin II [Moelleriella libera RCEF 2490]|uniref:Oligosaccharyltransferase subunit ribophorin II n=1 Tax=Moelleriella libera RCEF 2490 TaxID=1081109 RepID=A0A167XL14_9HYPO|nr:oligosaccharyltransferase subunit ribophorin II [Moelleriella libera RCEF 2490]
MRFPTAATVLALVGTAHAASSWTFADASVAVGKASDKVVEKFTDSTRVKQTLALGHRDSLKVSLTTKEGAQAKRPHQAFLVLREAASGLEAPFALTVKESGKGSVQITHKDLPVQLLTSQTPLEASIILGSTGATKGSVTAVFDIAVKLDPGHPTASPAAPLRYGKLGEIHHIFRADPKNPPKVVSLVFAAGVLATVPALFLGWTLLGGNFAHAQKAVGNAPVSHALFFGSIMAMEGVFLLYYSAWNLFQTLPVMGVVAGVAFLSGTKALGEVQGRRLAGER